MLRGRGGCYKHTFYGIESHRCMESTPSLACANKCVFCWRHHTNPVGTEWKWQMDEPEEIVRQALENHYQMIKQFRGAVYSGPCLVLMLHNCGTYTSSMCMYVMCDCHLLTRTHVHTHARAHTHTTCTRTHTHNTQFTHTHNLHTQDLSLPLLQVSLGCSPSAWLRACRPSTAPCLWWASPSCTRRSTNWWACYTTRIYPPS